MRERTASASGRPCARAWSSVGWDRLTGSDLADATTREGIKAAVAAAYPDEGPYTIGNWTGQLQRFAHEIRPGDLVVLPLRTPQVAIGRVTGPYEHRANAPEGMRHVRRVEWLVTDLDRQEIQSDLLDSMGSLLTVFEISRFGATTAGCCAGWPVWSPTCWSPSTPTPTGSSRPAAASR
ncbi:restriction endonuclease [Streptomyces sp. P9-A2]|uniref:restriction endonuclease n=1 Tax=Streptomyces sp. P9-A2 TaxID=3072284 RepID=UPI002FC8054F